MKKAVIVGAGLGGLALAIRLQSAGIATTLIEARDQPGGHAQAWHQDGFTFDAGSALFTDPDALARLWRLSGQEMRQDVTLLPVTPFSRLHWPDGTSLDLGNDDTALRTQIARFDPAEVAGYQRFLDYSTDVYRELYETLGHGAFLDLKSMVKAAPRLAQFQAWRSLHALVSSFIRNDRLRQAFSFQTLRIGGNPMTTSALYAFMHKLEKDSGLWSPQGGAHALVRAMATLFERLGGTLLLGDPVERIETVGDRTTGVVTQTDLWIEADAVASNADLVHSYADLLADHARGPREAHRLARKHWSPSLFRVQFGIEGSWPGIPHEMILFGPRYEGLLTDIFEHGVLSEDLTIHLHHPTVTDPSLAPSGHSVFQATVLVPHLGKLPVDWAKVGSILAGRILAEIERRLIPDLKARIKLQATYGPPDFARDLRAHLGSAFSLEPRLTQSAWLRTHNRDDVISNLYFVGAGTHPGAGLNGVVGSAQATAALMLEDLA